MRTPSVLLAASLLMAATAPALAAPADDARAAAKTWLGEIDSGRYQQSWQDAAPLFQSGVSAAKWAAAAKAVREPLGAVESRDAGSATLTDSLPGVPDGHYAVIRYHTVFAHKASAVETVTMADVNGHWKAAGYFVR